MPAIVCVASDFGEIRIPLELHRKLLGSEPPPDDGEADADADCDGETDGVADWDGEADGVVAPVHTTPLRVNEVGEGFEVLHEPLKPTFAVPPVGMLAFQVVFVTVT